MDDHRTLDQMLYRVTDADWACGAAVWAGDDEVRWEFNTVTAGGQQRRFWNDRRA